MSHDAAHNPANPVLPIIGVLGVAALGWAGVIAFHAVLLSDPPNAALSALPAELRGLVKLCGSQPDVGQTGFGNWIVGWMLMVVAMMLPPTLPLVRAADQLFRLRSDRVQLFVSMLAAFIGVWAMAGAMLFAFGSLARIGLNALAGFGPELGSRSTIAAGVAAISVGLFQFTQLKMACMDACRSPRSIMITKWRSAAPARSAFHIGMLYGMICFGCCWAMMVLGVLVGALMLPIMVICAVMMALERLLPASRPLIPIQAGFAILIGALLLAGSIPTAFN